MTPAEIEYELKKIKERITNLESSGPSLGAIALFLVILYRLFDFLTSLWYGR